MKALLPAGSRLTALCLACAWLGPWPVHAEGMRLSGRVTEAAGTPSDEDFVRLEAAADESMEAVGVVLGEMVASKPAERARVYAQSGETRREVVSGAGGRFQFDGLPRGVYEVHAVLPGPEGEGSGPKVSPTTRVRVVETRGIVNPTVSDQLVAVSGQVTDPEGRPVAGATVTGTAVPEPEVGLINRISTVTDAEGRYRLEGFTPVDLYRTAGFLNGGSLEAPGSLYTMAEIRVFAAGFAESPGDVPKVPLVTEARLVPARRLWHALSRLAAAAGDGDGWRSMPSRDLPASRGDTLTDIDIVLHPSEAP